MKDIRSILNHYHQIDFTKRKAALATVVKVNGSSYRSPGARMLITDDGRWIGSISGGCLEGDALRKARVVMNENRSMILLYDTREGSNQELGIGLGCEGIIEVFMEPIQKENELIKLFERFINTQNLLVMATIFRGDNCLGERALIKNDGQLLQNFSNPEVSALLLPDLYLHLESRKSFSKNYNSENIQLEVFIEVIQPTIGILLFGAGFDARPVSTLAKSLGWNVQVTDECLAHIAPLFFPNADKLKLCHREFIDQDFEISPYTACVLMSHNYEYDREVLKKIIYSPAPYIGILGPKKRFDKMVSELSREGIFLSEEMKSRIHAPIGLDIGAETPDEIAISILGEIQSKFSNRNGGFLKNRNETIHARVPNSEEVLKKAYAPDFSTN